MAREIKFRVWNPKYKEFSTWGFMSDGHFKGIPTGSHMSIDECRQYSQQFTGLNDSKGVEIYEGDIIRIMHSEHTHWNYERFRVYYCDDTGMFKITNDKSYPHDIIDSIGYKHIEVIGNINNRNNHELETNRNPDQPKGFGG